MRRRLVLTFVALTVLIVALYGIPRAIIRIDQVHDREQEQVDQSALLLASLVAAELDGREPVTQQTFDGLLRPGERVEYDSPEGTAVAAGVPAGQAFGARATEPVVGGGFVTLEYSQEAINQRVQAAVLPLAGIGLLLILLAWLAAIVLAGRLARPFQDLAHHAHQLGSGRFDLDVPHYDVPEAEEVGQALVTSARSLDQLVSRERDFAVNASHELRTPLTAVRLHLEDLSMWPTTTPAVSAELDVVLAELSRLDAAVAAFLEHDRVDRAATTDEVDVSGLLADAADRWRPVLARRGRDLEAEVAGDLRARLSASAVTDVLDVLFAHVLEHGEGRVTLVAERAADYLDVRLGDQSRRTQGTEMLHGGGDVTGNSLPRAAALVAAFGGHLTVATGRDTTFLLKFPLPHG